MSNRCHRRVVVRVLRTQHARARVFEFEFELASRNSKSESGIRHPIAARCMGVILLEAGART